MRHQEDTPISETPNVGTTADPSQQRESGESVTTRATQTAREATQSAQGTAGQYVEQGRERVTSQLGDQKTRLAEGLGSVSEAIRSAGQNLREQEQSQAARFIDQGAAQIDHLSHYLENHDVNELIGEAESFARNRPAIFLGGAFGLGLVAARFLKSSGQQARTPRY